MMLYNYIILCCPFLFLPSIFLSIRAFSNELALCIRWPKYWSLSISISSVAQFCSTLWDPMDCSMPGFPVHHWLPELAQIHVHQVSDAIQLSYPLSSPSLPAFSLSQHWVFSQTHRVFSKESFLCIRWPKYMLQHILMNILVNIQDWFPLGWTGWISLQSMGFSRVFSNTTVQKHQFFSAQLSFWSNSHIHAWLLEKR